MSLSYSAAEIAAMPRVKYLQNWNHKLLSVRHTTIRLPHNCGYLKVGNPCVVQLKGQDLYVAHVLDKQEIPFGNLPQALLALDTGYTGSGALKLFQSFYKSFNVNTLVTVVLLHRASEPLDYQIWMHLLSQTYSVNAYDRWQKSRQNGLETGHKIAPD